MGHDSPGGHQTPKPSENLKLKDCKNRTYRLYKPFYIPRSVFRNREPTIKEDALQCLKK